MRVLEPSSIGVMQSTSDIKNRVLEFIENDSLDGFWILDIENDNQEYTSPRFWDVLGYNIEQVRSSNDFDWKDVIYKPDLQVVFDLFQKHKESNGESNIEVLVRYLHKSGELKYFKCRSLGIRNAEGQLSMVVGAHVDCTKEKNIELESKRQKELFEDFFNLANQLLCITNREGEFIHINNAWFEELGYLPDEMQRRHFAEFLHPDDLVKSLDALQSIHEETWEQNFENRLLHKNGQIVHLSWRVSFRDNLIYACAHNITDRIKKDLEVSELQRTKDHLKHTNYIAKIGGWEMNIENEEVILSDMFRSICELPYHYQPKKFKCFEFSSSEVESKINDLIDALIETGQSFAENFGIITLEGKEKWVYMTATGEFNQNKCTRIYGTLQDITSQKKNELELEKQRDLLDKMNSIASIGGWQLDVKTRKFRITKQAKIIHDIDIKTEPSLDQIMLLYTEGPNRDLLIELVNNTILSGKPWTGDFMIQTAKQIERWMRIQTEAEFNEGVCIKVFGTVQDVTELKKTQVELQGSEQRFKLLIENLTDIIFTVDQDFCFQYSSPNIEKILGFNAEKVPGEKVLDFVHPDDHEIVTNGMNKIFKENKKVENLIYRVKHADGSWRWHSTSASLLNNNANNPQLLGAARDVTSIKETEQALVRSEKESTLLAAQYKELLDNQSVFIVKTDNKGYITYCNDYYKLFFKIKKDIIGSHSLESIPSDDHEQVKITIYKCFSEPGIPHPIILKKLNAEGILKGSKWEFKGIEDEAGNVKEILCVGFDITEQLENLEKAENLVKITIDQNFKLKNFSHIISHNIRSHSANLVSLADFIATTEDPIEMKSFIDMLKVSTSKLDETIYNLNQIISIEDHNHNQKVELNLKEEVQKTIQTINADLYKYKAQVNNDVGSDILISAIPTYLESILLNILTNAIRYRHPERNPNISLNIESTQKFLILSIGDNGIGIDLEKHGSKIFGMYKTFHGNTDARGFGLYITKTQMEAMGGKVAVESTLGIGTTFKLYFLNENS